MFRKISHSAGIEDEGEILFSTAFDYFFPDAARSPLCLLPASKETVEGLKALGDQMADPGDPGRPLADLDSPIPAAFTYLGQFIDHDVTARTDRNSAVSTIDGSGRVSPQNPDTVIRDLRNGRRPELDLDSVFGDGPGLAGSALRARTESDSEPFPLFTSQLTLNCFEKGPDRVDLPRRENHVAIIADMRNDENVIVSQLHTRILKFYNAVFERQRGSNEAKYIRARQLVRWAYQFIVVNDYLPRICDRGIVADTLANGPRALGSSSGRGDSFMPLEFSVAAFRFGHSMIRPFYNLNDASNEVLIQDLLGPNGNPANFAPDGQLISERVVDFRRFAGQGANVQHARRIDTKIAQGLFALPFEDRRDDPVLRHLARSNLLRAYNLSIPTGQAMCSGFGIIPLSPAELTDGESGGIVDVLNRAGFVHRTPLWYYILREAAVQQNGERLGELGSRLVCETLIGLLKQDPNSYLNNRADPSVEHDEIDVTPGIGRKVNDLTDLLDIAGVERFDRRRR